MQNEEDAQANNTYYDQIQLGRAFHLREIRGSLRVYLRPPLFISTFRTSIFTTIARFAGLQLGTAFHGCAAGAEDPDPAFVEKNPGIDHLLAPGGAMWFPCLICAGEVSEDTDKVKIRFIEPLMFPMLFTSRHGRASCVLRLRYHDGWHTYSARRNRPQCLARFS